MPNSFGNPFTIPQVQTSHLKVNLPDPRQSLLALIKLQAAQARAAQAASPKNYEGNPRYGKYVMEPQGDGTSKPVWVWGNSDKERAIAEAKVLDTAYRKILAGDRDYQNLTAGFEGFSRDKMNETLEKVRKDHLPRLAQKMGLTGEEASKYVISGLDKIRSDYSKKIDQAGVGTQIAQGIKQFFRNSYNAIATIGDTSKERVARGNALAEAAQRDLQENAWQENLQRMQAEGRDTLGEQLSNWGRSAAMHGTGLAAMMAPALTLGAVAGPYGAALGGALGAGLPEAGGALQRVATDPNLTPAQKEESIGTTALATGAGLGAIGAIPGPGNLIRGTLAKRAVAKAFPEGVSQTVAQSMKRYATDVEKAAAEKAFIDSQVKAWTPSLAQSVGIHTANAATLGGAFQLGSNAAYNFGTGQPLTQNLTEGLPEAVIGGAVLGLPFGLGGRARAWWHNKPAGVNPTAGPDWTRLPGAVGGPRGEGFVPYMKEAVANLRMPVAREMQFRRVIPGLRQRVRDAQAQQGAVPELRQRVKDAQAQPTAWWMPYAMQRSTTTPYSVVGTSPTQPHIVSPINAGWANAVRPQAVQTPVRTTPQQVSPNVIPSGYNGDPLQSARTFLDTKPTLKKTQEYFEKALGDGTLTVPDIEALRQERYKANKKATAQPVAVKALDKVLSNVNRNTENVSGGSRETARVEPVGQDGTRRLAGTNNLVDSTMPADTPTAPPAAPDANVGETLAGGGAAQERGNVGTPAPDTRQVETPPATPPVEGVGRTENPFREPGVKPAAVVNAERGARERVDQLAPEQRPGDAGNAESPDATFVNPETKATPQEKEAAVRENRADTPVKDRIQPTDNDATVLEKLTAQLKNANRDTIREGQAADEARVQLGLSKTLGDMVGRTPAQELGNVIFSFNKNLSEQVRDALRVAIHEQEAWHGTPNEIVGDKLSTDYLGSGEGAQVHGWGLYVALTEQVAKERYQHRLSADKGEKVFTYDNQVVSQNDLWDRFFRDVPRNNISHEVFNRLINSRFSKEDELFDIQSHIQIDNEELSIYRSVLERDPNNTYAQQTVELLQNSIDTYTRLQDAVTKFEVRESKGQRLRLEIPDDNVMLREDAKFSEQPKEVQDALLGTLAEIESRAATDRDREVVRLFVNRLDTLSGEYIYQRLVKIFGAKGASLTLLKHGIKGIRYKGNLDGECAVIFDGDVIRILNRFYDQNGGRGRIDLYSDGTAHILFGNTADASTAIHEFEHLFIERAGQYLREGLITSEAKRTQLMTDLTRLSKFGGEESPSPDVRGWAPQTHEKIAKAFEAYFREGKAPAPELQGIFERMKQFLIQLYQKAKALIGRENLPKGISEIFDRQLTGYKEKEVPVVKEEPISAVKPAAQEKPAPKKEVKVNLDKPFTERTYAITKKNIAPLLIEKMERINVPRDMTERYIETDGWYAIKEDLKRTRQLDPELERKLDRLKEYSEKDTEEFDFDELEQKIDNAIKNPTKENLDAAQKVIDQSADIVNNVVSKKKTILEEQVKSENEPPAKEYHEIKDRELLDKLSGAEESEYIDYHDLAAIRNRFWELANDDEQISTLRSIVGKKNIGKNADGTWKTPEQLTDTLTEIYRKFWERDPELTKSETNVYKKMKPWLDIRGIHEMPRIKGVRPENFKDLEMEEFVKNLEALDYAKKEAVAEQMTGEPRETTTKGFDVKQLDSFGKSLGRRFSKIWPNRDKTDVFVNQIKTAFVKKALGEKLTPKEQELYNTAVAGGVKPLVINKTAVQESIARGKEQGYDTNGVEVVDENSATSQKKMLDTEYGC